MKRGDAIMRISYVRKLPLICITLIFILSSVVTAISEDYSKYTTDYLLEMKSAIQAELDSRNINSTSQPDNTTVYNDENISIAINHISILDNSIKVNFLISCEDNISCLVIPNINEEEMNSVDGFEALKILKKTGSGHAYRFSDKGQDLSYDFEWDINTAYDSSLMSITIPINLGFQQVQTITIPVNIPTFPKAAGFTIIEFNGDIYSQTNNLIIGYIDKSEYFNSIISIQNLLFTPNQP